MKTNQRGAISLEMMIAVGLIIVLFGWAVSRSDMMQSRAGTLIGASNVVTLGENVRGLLKTGSGYGASGTSLVADLIASKGVPKNITISGSTIINDYNGTMTIASTGAGFTITDPNLPSDICIQEATKVSKTATFTTTAVNGNAAITGEVPRATATTQCNQAGNANSITFASAS